MKSKILISMLLCLFLITPNIVYATELPPNTDIPGHIGLVEEEPQQEEESQEPEYNCSFGCSHLPSEPHNYKPFNVYGESKTSYMGKARAATITIDLTSTGGAGQAPLKCLTQYERDGTQHWERCINHPGTGTYNSLYHNAGRINLSNHTLKLTTDGEFSCRLYVTLPKYYCTNSTCGYSRDLNYYDFPIAQGGATHYWSEMQHITTTPFVAGRNWGANENGHHYPICDKCRSSFTSDMSGKMYCSGKPWQPHNFDQTNDGQATDGKCVNCGVVSANHHEGQKAGCNYPQVGRGHSAVSTKCKLCDVMLPSSAGAHYGYSTCMFCLRTLSTSLYCTKLSGQPNIPGGARYQYGVTLGPGLTPKVSNSVIHSYYPQNGATLPISDPWYQRSFNFNSSTRKITWDFHMPQLTDKRHQNYYRFYYGVQTEGIADDGLAYYDYAYSAFRDVPDYVAPYGGIATPQNGTPSAWRDTVDVTVKAKDDWSETLIFSIYDSDRVSQLGQNFTVGARDASGYFNSSFKLIAEASAPKNIYLRATDLSGKYSDFGFQVQYVDTYAPRIQAPVVDNTKWARTKPVRFNSIEAGSRETKMSFNDGTVWNVCNQSGDTYFQDYIFTGDVYATQTRPIFFKDKLNNTSQAMFTINRVDNTKPTITAVTAKSNAIKTESTITVSANDTKAGLGEGSGVKLYAMTTSNTAPTSGWQSSNTFKTNTNGTYWLWVKDGVDLVSTSYSVVVSGIDKIAPVLKLTAPSNWTNGTVTITAQATDENSGVLSIEDPDGVVHSKDSIDFVVSQNGTYSFKVTDKAGNVSVQSITVSSIDCVVPTISLSAPTDWTNQPFDITIETNDDYSGVARIKLPDSTEPTEVTSFEVSQNGVYYFTVYDKAGNSTTDSIEVTCFDYVKPTAESSNLPTWWFVRPHEIKVTANDDYSGVRRIQTPDGEWHEANEVTYFVFENKEFPFVIEDNAGNTYTLNVPIDLVENTDPTIEVTGNSDKWTNKDIKINIKAFDSQSDIRGISLGGDKWDLLKEVNYLFTGNGEYTIVAEDNVGHRTEQKALINKIDKEVPTASYTVTPKEWTKGDVTVKVFAQDALSGLRSVFGLQSFTLSSNGTMHMQIEDNARNVLDLPIEVKNIDKDNPVIEGIGIADVSRGQAPLFIAASDNTSPVTKIEYQLVELNGKVNDGAWIVWEEGTKINAPFHGDIAARCFDSAGNVSEVLRKEFMIDTIPPRARARMSTLKPTTEPITITYFAEDMESGFNYTILPNKVITKEPEVEYEVETNGNYTFKSYDFAGNPRSTKVSIANLDKDPPIGKVTQFPTAWTKGDVQLHLTATDASSVTRLESVDQTATSNGDYIFYLEDEHGYKTELNHKVSNIDRIVPMISGSASNFIASIHVQDYESGVKQTVTPLGSSSSATVMFSVSPNSSYAISSIDNAGNATTRTLFVNAEGNGAFDEAPPISSNPNDGNSGGSNESSGKDEINTSKPENKPTHPKPEDGDYNYGKPNKNYPDGMQEDYQNTDTSSSSSSSPESLEATASSASPHLDTDAESSDSTVSSPDRETSVDTGMRAPTIIVESTQQPNSLFEPDLYLKQIGDSLVALGSLNLGNTSIGFKIALGVGATLAVCWIIWVVLFMLTALRGLKKTKEEDKDSEEDDFEA